MTVLDRLEKHLKKIMRMASTEGDGKGQRALDEILEKKETLDRKLEEKENQVKEIQIQLEELHQSYENERIRFEAQGGTLVENRKNYEEQKRQASSSLAVAEENIRQAAAGDLPLNLVQNLLVKIEKTAEAERESQLHEQIQKQMNILYDQYKKANFSDSSDENIPQLEDSFDFVAQEYRIKELSLIFNFSPAAFAQLKALSSGRLEKSRDQMAELLNQRSNLKALVDAAEEYLQQDYDEQTLEQIQHDLVSLELQIKEKEEELQRQKAELKVSKQEYSPEIQQYSRKIGSLIANIELEEHDERLKRYSVLALEVLERYKTVIQKQHVDALARTMTSCYKQLSNKKRLIDHVEIDPETLDLSYITETGKVIPDESLSAGEKQLMVISLLWALSQSSRQKLPVIIDTPLSRLDRQHRMSIVSNYYKNAGDQIIILSTDTEITPEYYNILKPQISSEFTLKYNEETKATTVEQGFFPGDR